MSDAALFIALFGGLFVIRVIAATVVFLWILPDGVRCPNCDAETLRVESRGALKVMPWFRSSWCYECDWHGMHRVREQHSQRRRRASPDAAESIPRERRTPSVRN
jgi:hypothetical protein